MLITAIVHRPSGGSRRGLPRGSGTSQAVPMGQAPPSSPGAPRASRRQKQKNPAPSAQILSSLETQGPVGWDRGSHLDPKHPVQCRSLCPCPCLRAPRGQRRGTSGGRGPALSSASGPRVWSECRLLSAASCPLSSRGCLPRPWALTRLPPLPSGTCPGPPTLVCLWTPGVLSS